jgi:hypothetical protein
MEPAIAGLAFPPQAYRAHYLAAGESGRLEHVRWDVIGWAAVGTVLYPVRLEHVTGRGVLVGSEWDPELAGFLGVQIAGAPLSELGEEVDRKARDLIRADMETEVDDAEADQD